MNKKIILSILFIFIFGFLFSFSIQEARADTTTFIPVESCYISSEIYSRGEIPEAIQTNDGDTSYIVSYSGSGWEYVACSLQGTIGSGTINSLTIYIRPRSIRAENPSQARTFIRIGTNNFYGTIRSNVPGSYTLYSQTYTTNPYTGSSWTWSDIENLQAGVGIYNGGGSPVQGAYCTQVYYVVDYTPPQINYPTVTTELATVNLSNNQATLKGNVTATGGENPSQRVLEWGTFSGSYTNSYNVGSGGTGEFSYAITLTPGTIYYYRAKAYNSGGWGYGVEKRVVIYQASGGQQSFKTHQCESDADCPSDININACQYTDNYCDTAATYECKSSTVTCGTNQATKGATLCAAVTTANYCQALTNACNGTCMKRTNYYGCNSSGSTCETTSRATSDAYLTTAGKVCSAGSEVAPTSGNYCDYAHGCVAGACYADKYWRGCATGSANCSSTGWVDSGADYNAGDGTVISVTETKVNAVCQTAVPSASLKCNTVLANNNNCQYTTYYRACGGTGSCRTDNTGAASVQTTCGANQATKGATSCSAVTTTNYCDYACDGLCRIGYRGCASSGSTCETTFRAWQNCSANTTCSGNSCLVTNYCATNQCRDGGGWHHKCSKWCDGSNNCTNWADATCVDHCINVDADGNPLQDCDETGPNSGGSCPSAPDFTISASPTSLRGPKVSGASDPQTTVTVTSLNSFNSGVTLSARWCTGTGDTTCSQSTPTGLTSSFSATPITPPANGSISSTLSIDTNNPATGSYYFRSRGVSGSLTHDTSVITLTIVDLSVTLSADPSSGTAPLNDVDLTTTVGGTATGTINYKFDCTSDGTWDYTFNGISDNPKTVVDACDYDSAATYTAKVRVERDVANPVEATAQITVNPGDTTSPTTTIKIIRTSTGENVTTAGAWLRADTYTIQFEDNDQAGGSGLNCENCTCEYSVYACDAGGTNCNTPVVSLASRTPNFSFDIVAGKTAPTYNLEGVGRYLIYSGARDMANYSATEYRYINFDFTSPKTIIE